MEDLNRAYVLAVAAKAGCIVGLLDRTHDYGVDGTFHQVQLFGGKRSEAGYSLDFQLKASTNWQCDDTFMSYDLEATAYNFLVDRNRGAATPCILIVFCLPTRVAEWLCLSEEKLSLRKCCYWEYLKDEITDNTRTKRVQIPRNQQFTPEAIQGLLEHVKQGTING
jgi:hypothetical protein